MIRTKQQSDYEIKARGLNRMLEGRFTSKLGEEPDGLREFLDKNSYPYYNMRDKSTAAGKFMYKLTKEEVLEASKQYTKFSVYESLAEADQRLILQGDIFINKEFILMASLSNVKGISNRIAMQEPTYKIWNHDLKEQREPAIRGLKQVIDYISKHSLIDMVVEFTLFEIEVGINKENILIWELRNY